MRKSKKIETSKLLLIIVLSVLGVLLVITTIYTFLAQDSQPLVAYITGTMALSSTAVGFYYWKAKNENLHKYKQDKKIGDSSYEE